MKYFIEDNNKKYIIENAIDGIVKGIDENKNEKNFKIALLKHITAIDDNGGERIISTQQWLMETNSLETSNEWEANSIFIKLFFSFSSVFCQTFLLWLGFNFTFWHPILFLIGLGGGIWGYKSNKSKLCLTFGILSCCLTLLSILLAIL